MIYEVERLYEAAEELQNSDSSFDDIVQNLRPKIADANFYRYGSRAMGVANENSDIDIFIEMGEFSMIS